MNKFKEICRELGIPSISRLNDPKTIQFLDSLKRTYNLKGDALAFLTYLSNFPWLYTEDGFMAVEEVAPYISKQIPLLDNQVEDIIHKLKVSKLTHIQVSVSMLGYDYCRMKAAGPYLYNGVPFEEAFRGKFFAIDRFGGNIMLEVMKLVSLPVSPSDPIYKGTPMEDFTISIPDATEDTDLLSTILNHLPYLRVEVDAYKIYSMLDKECMRISADKIGTKNDIVLLLSNKDKFLTTLTRMANERVVLTI